MTSLHFSPDVADFDPLRALAQVRGMADWAGVRYHCETSQQRAARDGKPDANRIDQTRGANLVALTRETHVMPETGTYFCRNLGGMKVPGMLIDDFRFTL